MHMKIIGMDACNNSRMAGWIFMKFVMDVMPFEGFSKIVLSNFFYLVIPTWRMRKFVRWDYDDANTQNRPCMRDDVTGLDEVISRQR
jgi:hypothetical protein